MAKAVDAEDIKLILKMAELELKTLAGERVFLTGCTGFFGKWITQGLLAADDLWELNLKLAVVTRDRQRALQDSPWLRDRQNVEWIDGDIRNLDVRGQFDTVIHAAAAASRDLNEEQPELMFDTIVDGTKEVLKIAGRGTCRRFIFVSSGAVYGVQPSELSHVPESYPGAPDPLAPKSAYGEAKRAAEFLCSNFARRENVPVKIARCYAFVGPYLPLNSHFAVGNFIRDVLAEKPIHVEGDGTSVRSYLYAADMVVWLMKILVNGQTCNAYNVGSGEAISIKDLAWKTHEAGCHFVSTRTQLLNPVLIGKSLAQGGLPQAYVPSVVRAREELGLKIYTSLPHALIKTLSWQGHEKLAGDGS